jgi:hypothetical protein
MGAGPEDVLRGYPSTSQEDVTAKENVAQANSRKTKMY